MQEDSIRTSDTSRAGYRWGTPEYDKDFRLRARYGISLVEWEALFEAQGRSCAICGRDDQRRWHTDHDHETGRVRGILCWGCNKSLGHFGDSADGVRKALAYLEGADAGLSLA